MSDEKNRDLTTEELLKKLMENFKEDPEDEATQLSVEDAAAGKKKVYRFSRSEKGAQQTPAPETAPDRDDGGVSEALEKSIRDAERFVEGMKDPLTEEPEEDEGGKKSAAQEDDPDEDRSWLDRLMAQARAEEAAEKAEAGRLAAEKAEAERLAAEKAEAERLAAEKAEAERLAAEKAEAERLAAEKAEAERLAAEKAEAERLAVEKAEAERLAAEKAEAERLAAEKAEAERLAAEKAEAERLAAEKAEAERLAAEADEWSYPDLPSFDDGTDDAESGETPRSLQEAPAQAPVEDEIPDPFSAQEESVPQEEEDEEDYEDFGPSEEPAVDVQLRDDGENAQLHFPGMDGEAKKTRKKPAPAPVEESDEPDENELNLMMIFGMEDDLEKRLGPEGLKKLKNKVAGDARTGPVSEEYENPDQNVRFFERFRRQYLGSTVRMIVAVAAFVLTAALEGFLFYVSQTGKPLSEWIGTTFFENPVFAALAVMQITMLLLALAGPELIRGFRSIFSGKASPEIFLSITGAFTLLYEGGLLFARSPYAQFYNLPLALCVLLSITASRTDLKRRVLSFKILSSRKKKLAVTHGNAAEAEAEKEAFGEYVSDTAGVYTTRKAAFIKGYGARSAKEPRYKGVIGILALLCAAAAVIFFVLGYYFSKGDEKLLHALETAIQALLLCVPLSAFISYSLPFYKASKKAFAMDSAIIGESSIEQYADATVISFDDKDVFPAKNVRVRSLKLYGDSRIDHVLFGAASLFHKLGGPLDEVFGAATKESGRTDEVDILEIERDGVESAVKGARVCVGGSTFMKRRGLLFSVDPDDEAVELEGRMRVMYLSIGKELCAKMYVEYKADEEIKDIMAALYKAGMCIGIRTLDPNIDDTMLRFHVDLSKYPVKVLRQEEAPDREGEEQVDSGVISKGKTKDLLKTLTFCRKVLQVIKVNTAIKILGILCGAGIAAAILFLGFTGQANSLFLTLCQLCTMLPVLIVSLIFS